MATIRSKASPVARRRARCRHRRRRAPPASSATSGIEVVHQHAQRRPRSARSGPRESLPRGARTGSGNCRDGSCVPPFAVRNPATPGSAIGGSTDVPQPPRPRRRTSEGRRAAMSGARAPVLRAGAGDRPQPGARGPPAPAGRQRRRGSRSPARSHRATRSRSPPAVLRAMARSRRAPWVAIETWSSWLAEVGIESTLAGMARCLFSPPSGRRARAAVTCGIMKPEFSPGSSARKAGSREERGVDQHGDPPFGDGTDLAERHRDQCRRRRRRARRGNCRRRSRRLPRGGPPRRRRAGCPRRRFRLDPRAWSRPGAAGRGRRPSPAAGSAGNRGSCTRSSPSRCEARMAEPAISGGRARRRPRSVRGGGARRGCAGRTVRRSPWRRRWRGAPVTRPARNTRSASNRPASASAVETWVPFKSASPSLASSATGREADAREPPRRRAASRRRPRTSPSAEFSAQRRGCGEAARGRPTRRRSPGPARTGENAAAREQASMSRRVSTRTPSALREVRELHAITSPTNPDRRRGSARAGKRGERDEIALEYPRSGSRPDGARSRASPKPVLMPVDRARPFATMAADRARPGPRRPGLPARRRAGGVPAPRGRLAPPALEPPWSPGRRMVYGLRHGGAPPGRRLTTHGGVERVEADPVDPSSGGGLDAPQNREGPQSPCPASQRADLRPSKPQRAARASRVTPARHSGTGEAGNRVAPMFIGEKQRGER